MKQLIILNTNYNVIKKLLIILSAITTLSFIASEKYKDEFKVYYKNMMHKGDLSAKANLSDYKNIEHLYALGAIENLKGEVLILDNKLSNTMIYMIPTTPVWFIIVDLGFAYLPMGWLASKL